ncbi:MAG: glutamyl-tRNA reductase [Bacteroidota bacterium]
MNELRAISINHHHFPLETIGSFAIPHEELQVRLDAAKKEFQMSELMYLGTCNRVEVVFNVPHFVCSGFTQQLLSNLFPEHDKNFIKGVAQKAQRFNGDETADHVFRVAASLDSLIIGEREIITQLRNAYEECEKLKLTGDSLRMLNQHAIRIAKEVYTHTNLSKKPVSIVSIAWKLFQEKHPDVNAKIVLVGAGQIITNFAKFLSENGYTQVSVYNRTIENAVNIAKSFNTKAKSISELKNDVSDFDALVVCTGSTEVVITKDLFNKLCISNKERTVIDLALPANVDAEISKLEDVNFIDMLAVQREVQKNISYREEALNDCVAIIEKGKTEFRKLYQERSIERAMSEIPNTIKEIRNTAVESVFSKELAQLSEQDRELVDKIISYMEKKYISVPMKLAKSVLLDEVQKN